MSRKLIFQFLTISLFCFFFISQAANAQLKYFKNKERIANSAPGDIFLNDLAISPNGRFVIGWTGDPSMNFDTKAWIRAYNIFAQPISAPILVNQPFGLIENVQVAIDESGAFVALLNIYSHVPSNPEADYQLYLYRYTPGGVLTGTYYVAPGISGDVTKEPNGLIGISYSSYTVDSLDRRVIMQVRNADGTVYIPNSIVKDGDYIGETHFRFRCDGSFAIATDQQNGNAWLRRYSSTGNPLATDTLIIPQANPLRECVGIKPSNAVRMTYNNQSIFPAMVYTAEVDEANTIIDGPDLFWPFTQASTPRLSMNRCGNYSIAYLSNSTNRVYARDYGVNDLLLKEFQVNTGEPNSGPTLIALADSKTIVAWHRQVGTNQNNIIFRRFTPASHGNSGFGGPDVTIIPLSCSGPGYAQLGSNPIPGYTYQWSPAIHLNNPNISNPIVTHPITTGSFSQYYILTVSEGICGCTYQDTVKVVFNAGC